MTTKERNKSAEIRELTDAGVPPGEVAKRVGVKSGAVASANRRRGARGRPRKHPDPVALAVEACARMMEEKWGYVGISVQLRNGEWKKFLA